MGASSAESGSSSSNTRGRTASARDGNALLLAAGKFAREATGVLCHADEPQASRNLLGDERAWHALRWQTESNIFLDAHMWKERVVLHHHAEAAPVCREIPRRYEEARYRSQRRRLSRPGRPDDRHEFARAHVEREVIEHDGVSVGDRNTIERDRVARRLLHRRSGAAGAVVAPTTFVSNFSRTVLSLHRSGSTLQTVAASS